MLGTNPYTTPVYGSVRGGFLETSGPIVWVLGIQHHTPKAPTTNSENVPGKTFNRIRVEPRILKSLRPSTCPTFSPYAKVHILNPTPRFNKTPQAEARSPKPETLTPKPLDPDP